MAQVVVGFLPLPYLTTGLFQYPGAEGNDHASFFGNGDELPWKNQVLYRMGPPYQSFKAKYGLDPVIENQRLIMELKLLPGKCFRRSRFPTAAPLSVGRKTWFGPNIS